MHDVGSNRPQRAGAAHRLAKRGQTIHHSLVARQRLVARNEERQRALHAREGARRLRHHAERDLVEKIIGRDDDVRDHDAGLEIALRERRQLHVADQDRIIIGDDGRKAGAQNLPLRRLAAQQRHLFGIFAQTRQREAEIGLVTLLLEIEPHQRAADAMGQPCADSRVEQRHPEREAGNHNVRARQDKISRDQPQDDRERHQIAQGR